MSMPRGAAFYAVGKDEPIDLDDEELVHNAAVQDQNVRAFRYHAKQVADVSGAEPEAQSFDLTEDGEELGPLCFTGARAPAASEQMAEYRREHGRKHGLASCDSVSSDAVGVASRVENALASTGAEDSDPGM